MSLYVPEEFTAPERAVLQRYFTNVDGPVFALVNLPEVVKGALFARYSRSPKGLRRLFLDEFVADLDLSGDEQLDATVGEHAERMPHEVRPAGWYEDDAVRPEARVERARFDYDGRRRRRRGRGRAGRGGDSRRRLVIGVARATAASRDQDGE